MLLQKVSNKPFSSLNDVDIFSYRQSKTSSAKSAAVTQSPQEKEDDDLALTDKALNYREDRLVSKSFSTMRIQAKEMAAKKRAHEKKTAAVEAFHSFLFRKYFQAFVKAVEAHNESINEERVEEGLLKPATYLHVDDEDEDDDFSKFTSHLHTGMDTFRRLNCSSDHESLIGRKLPFEHSSSNQRRFDTLDDKKLYSMRCAKQRAGASNLYDVPPKYLLLRSDDFSEERPFYRSCEMIRSISEKV
jgi:hypothetical protein